MGASFSSQDYASAHHSSNSCLHSSILSMLHWFASFIQIYDTRQYTYLSNENLIPASPLLSITHQSVGLIYSLFLHKWKTITHDVVVSKTIFLLLLCVVFVVVHCVWCFCFFWEMMIGVDCWLWWRNRWWCLCFFIFLLRNHTTKTMEFKRFLNSNKNI